MPIDRATLLAWDFEPAAQEYTHRDAILYALGLGLGRDPTDLAELPFVYERELLTLPTFAVTLASPGLWVRNPATGITWQKLVHSGQRSTFFRPLPSSGRVISKARICEVWDRGVDKGAVLLIKREIKDEISGEVYCRLEQTLMLLADGGFGGQKPSPPEFQIPKRERDTMLSFDTFPGQATLYRLNGDWNPLHIDPEVAAQAGFPRPILQGYCTYGIAGIVACKAAKKECSLLRSLECHFTHPVLPGDRLEFLFWQSSDREWLFQALVGDAVVLDRGRAGFSL